MDTRKYKDRRASAHQTEHWDEDTVKVEAVEPISRAKIRCTYGKLIKSGIGIVNGMVI